MAAVDRLSIGRMGRNFNINQPHGFLYFQDDNSAFDARPYSLTGIATDKASYNQARFGANIGGPLNIPKIFNGGNNWFFFAGWNGSRGSTPYDFFSTVPTVAERGGDFSGATYNNGTPVQIFNPSTGQQFQVQRKAQRDRSGRDQLRGECAVAIHSAAEYRDDSSGQNFHNVTSGDRALPIR